MNNLNTVFFHFLIPIKLHFQDISNLFDYRIPAEKQEKDGVPTIIYDQFPNDFDLIYGPF